MSSLRVSGDCWIHLAFDAAGAIDLERAEASLPGSLPSPGGTATREAISDLRRTPPGIQFRPKPLRVIRPATPIELGGAGCSTATETEITLYDFGAVSVAYRVRLEGASLESLRVLSTTIASSPSLGREARSQVDRIIGELAGAANRACVADPVEDHVVMHVRRLLVDGREAETVGAAIDLVRDGAELAAVLRAAEEPLSDGEIADALACTIAYGRRDLAIIDWNAAIIIEPDQASAADLLAVLEFANVELVELRFLDDRLDSVLDRFYRELGGGQGGWSRAGKAERRRLATLHMDSALLFEGINNAIKLMGDQYLARVYRLAARRFHLTEWDASILRKIETLQRLYEKTADEQSTRRMEVLEWIIIILIAISILVMFLPGAK